MDSNSALSNIARKYARGLAILEAIILFAIAGSLAIASFIRDPTEVVALVAEIVFATLGGIGLLVAAHGFKLKKNYGRAPTVLANGIALGVSYYMFDGGRPQLGVPLAILGLLTLLAALLAVPAEEN
ncbi:hypothetical protein LBMAG09_06520 [Actinomycetes bacterium]|nr:hypothetical protein LBMAG09_06520 [Actinomycetes bacterium]